MKFLGKRPTGTVIRQAASPVYVAEIFPLICWQMTDLRPSAPSKRSPWTIVPSARRSLTLSPLSSKPMNLVIRRAVQCLVLIGQRKSVNLFTGVMEPEDVGPRSNAHFG